MLAKMQKTNINFPLILRPTLIHGTFVSLSVSVLYMADCLTVYLFVAVTLCLLVPLSVSYCHNFPQDVCELKLTKNESYDRSCLGKADTYVDTQASQYICPITGLEMNGRYKFVPSLHSTKLYAKQLMNC
jgi:hypothetical protein